MNRHIWGLPLVLLVGCATPMSAMRDENKQLVRTVEELRDDRRAQDRKLKDLQHQLDKLRADRVTAVVASMPQLPVEVAGPEGRPAGSASDVPSRVVAVTDDGTEIVYEGDAALGKAATIDDEPIAQAPPMSRRPRPQTAPVGAYSAGDGIEISRRPAISARTTRMATRERDVAPAANADDAGESYRAAVELVKSGGHGQAIEGLRAFLRKYPRHDYADNAQYWLGEAFYAQKDYPHALAEFRNVIETYPRGNKVPDALLKVGYCYQALGQAEKARAVLEQVVNLYPKTEPAALATKRLETP
ncbi:MAG: tol-pal system protein YbgF [Myxococcales bacterium]|nr:tol-pal system protein YbgF [Myxococcales bacterium]